MTRNDVQKFLQIKHAWEQRKLGELAATFGYGLNAAAKSFDGRHKYIRITDIDESTRRFLCSSLTSPDIDFEEAAPYRLAEGTYCLLGREQVLENPTDTLEQTGKFTSPGSLSDFDLKIKKQRNSFFKIP